MLAVGSVVTAQVQFRLFSAHEPPAGYSVVAGIVKENYAGCCMVVLSA